MNVINTDIPDLLIIEPKVFGDQRGYFLETFQAERYKSAGILCDFVQDNLSFSAKGVLRGLHFQIKHPQAKLVQVLKGSVYDVAVDIRPGSPTFGKWVGIELSEDNHRQFFIPQGFAHAFCVLSDTALFNYKCSDYYNPHDEGGIIWSDPEIGIDWPMNSPVLSQKDSIYPKLSEIKPENLPVFSK